jgi:hypothetical protein
VGRELLRPGWVTTTTGGKLVGWLEVGFTTRSRPCADADPEKHTAANTKHTARKNIFLKTIKLYLQLLFSGGSFERAVIFVTYI